LTQQLDDLKQIVEDLDFSKEDIYDVSSLPSTNLILTDQEKELGSVAIDFGARTTSITVYEEDNLVDIKSLPYGSGYLTDDIGICLQLDPILAEKVKKLEGYIDPRKLSRTDMLNLVNSGLTNEDYSGDIEISRKKIAAVMVARLDEIFDAINQALISINPSRHWPGGITFYGGGSNLINLTEYARTKLGLPCKIAVLPTAYSRLGMTLGDTNALSLLHFLAKVDNSSEHSNPTALIDKSKSWLKSLLP
jgi:cell division protein FtsA